ncbi:MAG: VWA domain-containing protein [Eubacteriales bacterium]|nr:VWA domain-containing protein [Eubacteriales bacterium]MDD4323447.1 VWA domain-containing protein [Eubacteriales bacterium]MDD4540698.1 VWA domain-containing protein [Eubacteriales bacterium]
MRKTKFHILLLIVFLLLTAFNPVSVIAAPDIEKNETPDLSDRVAIVLIVDNSSSMLTSDPEGNRFKVAEMVLELMGEEDYFSLISFSDDADTLLPMANSDSAHLDLAKEILASPPVTAGYSDYMLAFTRAEEELQIVANENLRRFIIFLTDGVPTQENPDFDPDEYIIQMESQLLSIDGNNQGVPVYTVGFGTSDEELLSNISQITRGVSFRGDSDTLAVDFFEILRELKNRYDIIDQRHNGEIEPFNVSVDEYTRRVFLLSRDENGESNLSVESSDGTLVEPAYTMAGNNIYHLLPAEDGSSADYRISGNLEGTIKAVRDTRIKLWITAPKNNSILPLAEEFTIQISQNATIAENTELKLALEYEDAPVDETFKTLSIDTDYYVNFSYLEQTGDYELTASLFLGEQIISQTMLRFTLSEEAEAGQVFIPGVIDVTTPEIINAGETEAIDVQVTNNALYPEQLNIMLDGVQLNNEPIIVAAGETILRQFNVTPRSDDPLLLEIDTFYDATIVRLQYSEIQVEIPTEATTAVATEVRDPSADLAEEAAARQIQRILIIVGITLFFLLLIALIIYLIRRILLKRKPLIKLIGCLIYKTSDDGESHYLNLSGEQPMTVSVGREKNADNHIHSDIEEGFKIILTPIQSDKNETLIELRCTPPGSLTVDGALRTTVLLSDGDRFEMAGLDFKYLLDNKNVKAAEEGEDVLQGRL